MSPMNNRLLRPTSNYDADALRYINAVQVADGQALEPEVRTAIDAFVRGCKSDSAGYAGDPTRTVWDALQACCIMAGARTISGALVPLAGPAPTAEGAWASGDYDRATGMKGNGSSLYLRTGLENTSLSQDDAHCGVYATEHESANGSYFGAFDSSTGDSFLWRFNASSVVCRFMAGGGEIVPAAFSTPFLGVSRNTSAQYIFRDSGADSTITRASGVPTDTEWVIFNRSANATYDLPSDARLAFYSIGSSLSLSNLDNRVSTLISAIAAALS